MVNCSYAYNLYVSDNIIVNGGVKFPKYGGIIFPIQVLDTLG
jgi:hypothetical protein